jgi:hypothetical protein
MHLMGFSPSKANPDVRMHDFITHYEYVIVYVDDIIFIGKEPQQFFDSLTNENGFKLKVVGTPAYHLDGDFYCDSESTLAWGANSYIFKMLNTVKLCLALNPKNLLLQ